jgi:hypothetical protein
MWTNKKIDLDSTIGRGHGAEINVFSIKREVFRRLKSIKKYPQKWSKNKGKTSAFSPWLRCVLKWARFAA